MKKNHFRLLPIFLSFPFLMANAPAPQVFSETYKDFNLSFISEEKISDNEYRQHFTLENTGKGYISRIYIDDLYSASYYGSHMDYESKPYRPFTSGVYEPGYNNEIVLTSTSKMPDFRKVTAKAEGFSTFVNDLPVQGTKEITMISGGSSDSYYYYKIDLDLKLPDTHYNYGAILKLDYKDTVCYIEVSEGRGYRFETTEELELDKLTVLDVIGIKSEPYLTHQLGCGGDFSGILAIVITVFVVFAILLSFGIFAAIFFPAMARRRRRRRLALQEQQKKQNEKESQ